MKILKTVQKVPGGMMVIPLLLGVILNTVCPSLLQAGGYVTALWSSGGANTAIAIFLFCVGAQIQLRQGGQILKFMSLAGTFGDDTDIAAQAILNINDGPFLTLVAVGASGMADIPLQSILCAVAPILVGLILGNLDKDIADFLKPGLNVLIPFFAFCLGAGISLGNLVTGGLSGILLGVICVAWSGLFCILADKFILKRPGYAGAALSSAAGNCVATPAAVAVAAPAFEPYVESATAQCAAAVIVTVLLVPLVTTWAAKKWGTAAEWEAKKAAKAGNT